MIEHPALVVGARPNFLKAAPLLSALEAAGIPCTLIHTGQHYDDVLDGAFFRELDLPDPDHHLGVGSAPHGAQTGRVMEALEEVLTRDGAATDLLLVVGDVNSTLAGALTAVKLGIPVGHVEAGLRSFDRRMPEEINREVTDSLSALLFTHSPEADQNLEAEGVDRRRIFRVGNVMVDSLRAHMEAASSRDTLARLSLDARAYFLATLHRPENVDDPGALREVLGILEEAALRLPVVLPAHPRLAGRLAEFGLGERAGERLRLLPPEGYLDFLRLQMEARAVLTDSGGIQEETTALGVPCLTLRSSTERPVTVTEGTNTIVGRDRELAAKVLDEILAGRSKEGKVPDLWDGRAAERIVEVIGKWGQARMALQ